MELFEKVYIKSEDDLPKETGRYFCYDNYTEIITALIYEPSYKDDKENWLKHIDWWLRPVEQKKLDVPSTKERFEASVNYSSYQSMPDGEPDFDTEKATIFDDGAAWAIDEIKRRNK